jgi:RNA polymerase sigma-70 factor (ECF subfamily)
MSDQPAPDDARSLLAENGAAGLGELFDRYRERLRGMVSVRLDQRLQGRIDPSDVIQDAFMEAQQRLPDYQRDPQMTPFLWIRFLTMQQLIVLHRRHLLTRQRDARREVSRVPAKGPAASSVNLTSLMIARLPSPSQAVQLAERQQQLQQALEQMTSEDREVLALKHYQQLTINEVAEVLELTVSTASRKYYAALKKLKHVMQDLFGAEVEP